jgi:hypothetical protein
MEEKYNRLEKETIWKKKMEPRALAQDLNLSLAPRKKENINLR